MFGLYDAGEGLYGDRGIERRAFCFSRTKREDDEPGSSEETDRFMELRVHRADGKKRIPKEIEEFRNTYHSRERGNGVE